MCRSDVITRVHEPTPWVSSLTYDKVWQHTLEDKTVEEVSHSLCGAKFFSKLDARSVYWAVEIDDAASLLTTFNIHQVRYRFKRLPFGLHLSQDMFQEHMDHMLRQLTGIINITDDIIVFGHDLPTHDANLNALMKRATEYGLVFNADKCSLGVKNVSFFGLIYSEEGTRPTPKEQTLYHVSHPDRRHFCS